MTDPQQIVDEALAPTSGMPSMPVESTSFPETPIAPPIPEPIVTQTMPSLPPTPPAAEPATPVVTTTTTTTSVPMGDETPLAFATPPPAPAPLPSVEQMTPSPSSSSTPVKPKAKSKILMTILGIFALFGILGTAGYYAYQTYLVPTQEITVAAITSKAACSGCRNGGWLVWRDGKCKSTGICGNTKVPSKNTKNPNGDPIASAGNKTDCNQANGTWCQSKDSLGKAYAFCIPDNVNKGCNTYATERGYTIVYGASWSPSSNGNFKYKCSCGGNTYYFDRQGICNSTSATTVDGTATSEFDPSKVADASYYDKWGLCGIITNPQNSQSQEQNRLDYNDCFSCSATECHIKSGAAAKCSACTVVKYTCPGQVTGNSCTSNQSTPALSAASAGKCGQVEQIDVICGGHYIQSRTVLNGACTKASTPPSVTTSLTCNDLTKNVADNNITLNQPITLTCAGSVVPAGTAITYQFRYMIGTGAWQNLANTTAKTATLTPTQCGVQYQAQCRACATLDGVKQCDPVWQGVAP